MLNKRHNTSTKLTKRHSNPISLSIQPPPDLDQIAVPLHLVLYGGALHQEGVHPLAGDDPLHPVLVVLLEHAGLRIDHLRPHPVVDGVVGVLEEGRGGSAEQRAVLDLGLLRQVLSALDGGSHAFHGEEGGEVGGVGGRHDEGEEPPHAGDHPCCYSSEE